MVKGATKTFGQGKNTHLTHRVGILCVHVFVDTIYLALKFQLPSISEIQSWGVDDGEQDSIKPGLADFHTSSLDALRVLR